jgi:predicted DNA-binding ArsR family transcriptional regulator
MKRKAAAANSELADWCAVLATPMIAADAVPPGWLTVAEIAEKIGKSRERASHLTAAAYKRGEVEKKIFRIPTGRGPFPVPHYKPVSK